MHRFSIRSSPVNHIQRSACCRLTQLCLLFGSILCFFTASILIFEQEVIKLLDLSYLVQIPHLISLHKTNMYVNVVFQDDCIVRSLSFGTLDVFLIMLGVGDRSRLTSYNKSFHIYLLLC